MSIELRMNLIIFLFLEIVYADLKLCMWRDIDGICIPTEDCFGECVKSELCEKEICCLRPYIIRKKCYEYQQEVSRKSSNCSHEQLNTTENKIIGGELARRNEFPFMAAIGYQRDLENKIEWVCGGSVISHEFILTAAHCLDEKVQKIWVLIGTNNLDDPNGIKLEVSQIIKHPKYKSFTHYYDIALLKLQSPLYFSPRVHPACLLFEEEQNYTTSIAIGWGKTNEEEENMFNELRKVKLRVIYLKECKKYHTALVKFNGLPNSMICAGQLSGGKDTCQGDSGGPLVIPIKQKSKLHGIIGITSTSVFGCGAPNSPSIYTRISYYLTWIAEIVWCNESN